MVDHFEQSGLQERESGDFMRLRQTIQARNGVDVAFLTRHGPSEWTGTSNSVSEYSEAVA